MAATLVVLALCLPSLVLNRYGRRMRQTPQAALVAARRQPSRWGRLRRAAGRPGRAQAAGLWLPKDEARAMMEAQGNRGGKGLFGLVVNLIWRALRELPRRLRGEGREARDWNADEAAQEPPKEGTEASAPNSVAR